MNTSFLSLAGLTQYDIKIKEFISTAINENSPFTFGGE